MTLSQALRYLLKRRSFYALLVFLALLFAAAAPIVDRHRHFAAVPIVVGALALITYLARVLTLAQSQDGQRVRGSGRG
jgi:hypothetical protein